ncbi:hypothetical protein EU538_05960 [Candidatus Thorarchaeota archaeon]|nr:MAG: hypothetical protein EU538_05960 [Candidatus Thorarchaeota archaeon]
MIRRILQLIITEEILTEKQIAKELGIQEATVQDILRLLLQRGLLRPGECNAPQGVVCSSCPMASSCKAAGNLGETYYVTEKGKMYARTGEQEHDAK